MPCAVATTVSLRYCRLFWKLRNESLIDPTCAEPMTQRRLGSAARPFSPALRRFGRELRGIKMDPRHNLVLDFVLALCTPPPSDIRFRQVCFPFTREAARGNAPVLPASTTPTCEAMRRAILHKTKLCLLSLPPTYACPGGENPHDARYAAGFRVSFQTNDGRASRAG